MKLIKLTRTVIVNPEHILSVSYIPEYNCIEIMLNAPRRVGEVPVVEIYPRNWLHRRIIYNRILNAMEGEY